MIDIKKYDSLFEKALAAWGPKAQLLMVLEEMSELQKEILKNINRNKENKAELIDETADVYIVLEQLLKIYNIKKEVKERIPLKIERMAKRLETLNTK